MGSGASSQQSNHTRTGEHERSNLAEAREYAIRPFLPAQGHYAKTALRSSINPVQRRHSSPAVLASLEPPASSSSARRVPLFSGAGCACRNPASCQHAKTRPSLTRSSSLLPYASSRRASDSRESSPVSLKPLQRMEAMSFTDSISSPLPDEFAVCPVCMERVKNLALSCGHCICRECGQTVSICPLCRRPIQFTLPIFY